MKNLNFRQKLNIISWIIFLFILAFYFPIKYTPSFLLSQVQDQKTEQILAQKYVPVFKQYGVSQITVEPFTLFYDLCWTRLSFTQTYKNKTEVVSYWTKRCIDPNLTGFKYDLVGDKIKVYHSIFASGKYDERYIPSNIITPLDYARRNIKIKTFVE